MESGVWSAVRLEHFMTPPHPALTSTAVAPQTCTQVDVVEGVVLWTGGGERTRVITIWVILDPGRTDIKYIHLSQLFTPCPL